MRKCNFLGIFLSIFFLITSKVQWFFVNSDNCIGKNIRICPNFIKKRFEVNIKYIFLVKKIRHLGNYIYDYAQSFFGEYFQSNALYWWITKLWLHYIFNQQGSNLKKMMAKNFNELYLKTFISDGDLFHACNALKAYAPSLESLHLLGIQKGTSGFPALVKLVVGNTNLKHLYCEHII